MNAPEKLPLPDIQSTADARQLAIQRVGVRGIVFPVTIAGAGGAQASVARVDMYVGLPADQKGTHMSRFLEVLHVQDEPLSHAARDGLRRQTLKVLVPVTSLCPCSKEISAYGAHNQRSHVTIAARLSAELPVESLIEVAERAASCELWGLLKRPDEKYVTERAYENPKFVEDLVRDIALALDRIPAVEAYTVESENFESIHNHSAYALIERERPAA